MTLSQFIRETREQLLQEWEEFARIAQPDDANLDRHELRDWAGGLLDAIATEMETSQIEADLERSSKKLRPADAPEITEAARTHAMDRLAQGFNLNQMVSEYRSLRTSVAVLWLQQGNFGREHIQQLIRFDEALDHAMAESIRRYTTVLERARDLFSAALGHDLRSPLGSIRSTAEAFLQLSDDLQSYQVQGVVRIRNATNRISKMIDDLIDFTHTRLGGRLPVSRKKVDLMEICLTIIDEVKVTYPDRDIRLNCHPDLVGCFDADRIGQMLSNLISNAVKYGRTDTPVTVNVQSGKGQLVITVHNEGDPIPKKMRRAIFEPLMRGGVRDDKSAQQSHPATYRRGEDGLGLGLYIAREIAEAHGGHIDLRSSADDGTTFEVRLPRIDDS